MYFSGCLARISLNYQFISYTEMQVQKLSNLLVQKFQIFCDDK